MPVDKALPWRTAKRENDGEREAQRSIYIKKRKEGIERDRWEREDGFMQHLCHVNINVNSTDVSILVVFNNENIPLKLER